MNPGKIVMNKVNRDCCDVVFDLLGESICEARKTAHSHSHGQVLPLYVAGRNMLRVGIPAYHFHVASDAGCRGIARVIFQGSAIDFLQSGEISISTKGTFNRFQVSAMSVCSDLNAASDTASTIVHKLFCPTCIPAANQITDTEFCVCIDASPCPN